MDMSSSENLSDGKDVCALAGACAQAHEYAHRLHDSISAAGEEDFRDEVVSQLAYDVTKTILESLEDYGDGAGIALTRDEIAMLLATVSNSVLASYFNAAGSGSLELTVELAGLTNAAAAVLVNTKRYSVVASPSNS